MDTSSQTPTVVDPASTFRRVLEQQGRRLATTAFLLCGEEGRGREVTVQAFARAWTRWSVGAAEDLLDELRRWVVRLSLEPAWRGRLRLRPPPSSRDRGQPTGRVGKPPAIVDATLALPTAVRQVVALAWVEQAEISEVGAFLGVRQAEVTEALTVAMSALAALAGPEGPVPALRSALAVATISGPSPSEVAELLRRRRHGHLGLVVAALAALGLGVGLPLSLAGSPTTPKEVVLSTSGGAPGTRPRPESTTTTTTTQAPTSAPTSPADTAVATQALPPATTPPAVSECTLDVTTGPDGNVAPLFCQDGGINVLAWQAYAKWNPKLLGLGPGATAGQVSKTVCNDTQNKLTASQELNAGLLAERYYGWKLPTSLFNASSCPGR